MDDIRGKPPKEPSMRIAELSRRSGIAVPTIKYYLREGLLPPGERTSPNQARYTDVHLKRLRLIRALVDVGGLSIARVQEVLASVDAPEKPLHDVLGIVQGSMSTPGEHEADESWSKAERAVSELIERRGWHAMSESPAGRTLASVIVTAWRLGYDDFVGMLDNYAKACERIAEADIAYIADNPDRDDLIERAVVGTALGDAAISGVRRLAQQNFSHQRLAAPDSTSCTTRRADPGDIHGQR
jgi:DNA-binding transcriptional MerR regulator